MKDNLTIPTTLNVGFQNRKDTYTGKLAYVVYTDKQGKLRKEASWTSWCDKNIKKLELKNEPTSGFVLNRDVGGVRGSYSHWNARVEKVRVYDPRGFEFEIDIPNLLFVLQECSAIKGKGLEGDFVYSWNGTQLILLPVTSQEYSKSVDFGKLQEEKVSQEEMVIGCAYITKKKETVIYMGKHPWWGIPSTYGCSKAGAAKHVFARTEGIKSRWSDSVSKLNYANPDSYILETGFTKLAMKTSTSPVPQYADIHDVLMKSCLLSKPESLLLTTSSKITRDKNSWWHMSCVMQLPDGGFLMGSIQQQNNSRWDYSTRPPKPLESNVRAYTFHGNYKLSLKNGRLVRDNYQYEKTLSLSEVVNECKSLVVVCENGTKTTVIDCRL